MRFEKISLEKYSWSLGTTSFRVEDLKFYIPEQLKVLNKLNNNYPKLKWDDRDKKKQIIYSQLLTSEKIFEIQKTLDKDARVKTSSLAELGFTTENRIITEVGNFLLKIENETKNDETITIKNLKYSNIFDISEDSFIYLKQLLKYQTYDIFKIKPILGLLYVCSTLDSIDINAFTFIIPLCKTKEEIEEAVTLIKNNSNHFDFILKKVKETENTRKVEEIIKNYDDLTEEEILILFPHGKGSSYVKDILKLYSSIKTYDLNKKLMTPQEKITLLDSFDFSCFKEKGLKETKDLIFGNLNNFTKNEKIKHYENSFLGNSKNILYDLFVLYTFNAYVSNLKEYQDLNLRYILLTDIFIFEEDYLKLDLIPKIYFKKIKENLLNVNIIENKDEYRVFLEKNQEFNDIYPFFSINIDEITTEISKIYPDFKITNNLKNDLDLFISKQKKDKFDYLIENKFTRTKLAKLLRDVRDNNINNLTSEGFVKNIPTILEYLIGISWYVISNKQGNIYEILNLKLNSNLYPVRFASGGQSDLLYKYPDGHDLIIEVTMTEKENQRKLELEPVARHLGRYKIDQNNNSSAIFIAPYLDPNVLVSFRSMKNLPYYNPHNLKLTDGLEIIPLSIENLIFILENDLNYEDLKNDFIEFHNSKEKNGYKWYHNEIHKKYS